MDPGDTRNFSPKTLKLLGMSGVEDPRGYQREIAQRRHSLEREIRALNTRHNAVTPICQLPNEILSNIFLIASARFQNPRAFNAGYTLRRAIKLTHVCKHWRDVGLECAVLWSKLDFFRPQALGAMLARSRGAVLDLELNTRHIRYPMAKDEIYNAFSEVPRLRSVSLSLHNDNPSVNQALSNWSAPAPNLESLVLSEGFRGGHSFPADTVLFGGNVPALRHLEFWFCTIPWDRLPLSSTIHSFILLAAPTDSAEKDETYPARPSSSHFFASLQGMSSLQTLDLVDCLPDAGDIGVPTPLVLPSLKKLKLKDIPSRISHLLANVHIPHISQLRVNFRGTSKPAEIGGALELLIARFRGNKTAQGLAISRQLDSQPHCKIWFQECPMDPALPLKAASEEYAPLEIAFSDPDVTHFHQHLHKVQQLVDVSKLEMLRLDLSNGVATHIWEADQPPLPNLRVISLYEADRKSLHDFLGALKSNPTTRDPNPATVSFPALSHLYFNDCEVADRYDPTSLLALAKALEGKPSITNLTVSQCSGFTRNYKSLLPSIFKNIRVEWDGIESNGVSRRHDTEDDDSEGDRRGADHGARYVLCS